MNEHKISRLAYWTMGLLLISTISMQAQYFQFSQYNLTPARTNIANVASDNYQNVNIVYRNQSTAGDFSINTSAISYQRPFRKKGSGERWGGFGIDILDDRSALNGLLNKQRIGLSWALNINTGRYQSLAIGVSGRLKTQRFNIDKLTTGSQYVPGRGFLPTFPKNESFLPDRRTSIGLNTSILYQNVDKNGQRKNHFGLSFFDLNEPRESFLKNEDFRLPATSILELGFRMFEREGFSGYPNALVTFSAKNAFINTGITWKLDLSNSERLNSFNSLSVLTNYVVGSYGILGIQLQKDEYTFGFSYDVGLGKTVVANSSAIEVSFVWNNLIEIQPAKVRTRKPKKVKPAKEPKVKKVKQPKVKKQKKEKTPKVKKEKPVKTPKVKKTKEPKVKAAKPAKDKNAPKVKIEKVKKEKPVKAPKVKKEKSVKIPKPKKEKTKSNKKEEVIPEVEELKNDSKEEKAKENEFVTPSTETKIRIEPVDDSAIDSMNQAVSVADNTPTEALDSMTNVVESNSLAPNAVAGEIIYNVVEVERVNISFEFEYDQSRLLQPVKTYLDDLSIILLQDDFLNIEIIGHTDQAGTEAYNLLLSQQRADAIRQYLISLNIPAHRITATGKGELEPILGATDVENRRVEIYIYR